MIWPFKNMNIMEKKYAHVKAKFSTNENNLDFQMEKRLFQDKSIGYMWNH